MKDEIRRLRIATGLFNVGDYLVMEIAEPQLHGEMPVVHRHLAIQRRGGKTLAGPTCECRIVGVRGDTLIGLTGEFSDSIFLHYWRLATRP